MQNASQNIALNTQQQVIKHILQLQQRELADIKHILQLQQRELADITHILQLQQREQADIKHILQLQQRTMPVSKNITTATKTDGRHEAHITLVSIKLRTAGTVQQLDVSDKVYKQHRE